jgi:predicted phage-related endonuclease
LGLLTGHLEDFNNRRTVFLNQLHALSHSAYAVKEVEKNLKKIVKELEKGIVQDMTWLRTNQKSIQVRQKCPKKEMPISVELCTYRHSGLSGVRSRRFQLCTTV